MRRVTLVVTAVGTEAQSTIVAADPSKQSSSDESEEGTIRLETVVSDDRAKEIIDSVLGGEANTKAFEQTMETLVQREMESASSDGTLFERLMSSFERTLLGHVYESCQGIQTRTAEQLGINRNTLHKKLSKYELLLDNSKTEPIEPEPETTT